MGDARGMKGIIRDENSFLSRKLLS